MPPNKTSRSERRAQFKTKFARYLRNNLSEAERKLWTHLRGRRMAGIRFRRQQPIGPYIVDFYCSKARLIIELDGGQHASDEAVEYDSRRTTWLKSRGYRVLRFSTAEFREKRDSVLDTIWHAVQVGALPHPEPPQAVRPSLEGRAEFL
jgi:very-short-patch-repair endonuclease